MVHQRIAFPDSERGYDVTGSGVHEDGCMAIRLHPPYLANKLASLCKRLISAVTCYDSHSNAMRKMSAAGVLNESLWILCEQE